MSPCHCFFIVATTTQEKEEEHYENWKLNVHFHITTHPLFLVSIRIMERGVHRGNSFEMGTCISVESFTYFFSFWEGGVKRCVFHFCTGEEQTSAPNNKSCEFTSTSGDKPGEDEAFESLDFVDKPPFKKKNKKNVLTLSQGKTLGQGNYLVLIPPCAPLNTLIHYYYNPSPLIHMRGEIFGLETQTKRLVVLVFKHRCCLNYRPCCHW